MFSLLLLVLLLPFSIILCREKCEKTPKKHRKSSSVTRTEIDGEVSSLGVRVNPKKAAMQISASTDFALSLLRAASRADKNFVISPFSLGAALAIVHDGAKGETQAELTRLLGKSLSPSEVTSLFSTLTSALSEKNAAVTTSVANRFFLDKEFALNPDYQSHVEKEYNSGAENIDFKNGRAAAKRVNSFVSKNTKGMIPTLVDSGSFSNVRAILINAVYFKGAWATPFKSELTVTKKFIGLSGARDAQFMQANKLDTHYSLTKTLAVVSLHYTDPAFSLVVLMPTGDFGEWREKLTSESLQMTLNNLTSGIINLKLPKFKIESTTDGKYALEKCGVYRIFSKFADLSGISDKELFVSAIVHKAVIEVSEWGTVAAATGMKRAQKASLLEKNEDITFDRPFVYVLRREDYVLFIGEMC